MNGSLGELQSQNGVAHGLVGGTQLEHGGVAGLNRALQAEGTFRQGMYQQKAAAEAQYHFDRQAAEAAIVQKVKDLAAEIIAKFPAECRGEPGVRPTDICEAYSTANRILRSN